jgi:Flp pilus assembly protein CpaB
MRRITLLIAAVLGIISAAGLIYINVLARPAAVEIVLAERAIPAGTPLRADMFRVVQWNDVDPADAAAFVSAANFPRYIDRMLLVDLPAGSPLAIAAIDAALPEDAHLRLSAVLTDADAYYFVLPASPDHIGNWVQPNDRVDLLVSVGRLELDELRTALPTPSYVPPAVIRADESPSLTIAAPATKLVLQNLRVLRVDRAPRPREASSTGSFGAQNAPAAEDAPPGDVLRIYVEVDREQLEILTFVRHNGEHDFAVRAPQNRRTAPSTGVAWEDFARWFFAQRGNRDALAVQPFVSAGPYTETTSAIAPSAP